MVIKFKAFDLKNVFAFIKTQTDAVVTNLKEEFFDINIQKDCILKQFSVSSLDEIEIDENDFCSR